MMKVRFIMKDLGLEMFEFDFMYVNQPCFELVLVFKVF